MAAVVSTLAVAASSAGCAAEDEALRVSGSTTVNPVVSDAAKVLRQRGLEITVDTQGGSAGGIAQLASGQIDVAMSSKPIDDEDRDRFSNIDFVETEVGRDAVAIVIRHDVYEAGVRSLTREQARRIFEGEIANWSEVGGPDLPVYVYNKEPGRGTREVLDKFLYGSDKEAPPDPVGGNYSIVGGNEETRTKLSTTPGSVAPLSVAFAEDQPELAIVAVEGMLPEGEDLRSGEYPLSRPLLLITDGTPQGDARTLIDFARSAEGQRLVSQHGYVELAKLEAQ
ncbi:phosphate ABC transporter substrate-binding protein [Saccharomonospora saliphila]|uniref:phosphate ABC transporter substrate-binding protein n=1 Tax=Saccharomonospora saliphila TaxID=369829 RepID=UPI00048C9FCB|nr:phosphate ABC transporter substrate-binding protein [Saccharomonospora saliphila]